MPKSVFVYEDPTIDTSADGDTPCGIYDNDQAFASESVDVAKYVSRKLGHPVMQIEIPSSSIYACFEEATSDYSLYINQYNMKNWLWDDYGNTTKLSGVQWSNSLSSSSMGTGSIEPQKPNMGASIFLSEKYGEEAEVGGDAKLYSGSVTLVEDEQDYDLQSGVNVATPGVTPSSTERLEIRRVYNQGPAAISKFYDPSGGSYEQKNMLDNFGMGNASPAVSFTMRPLYWDATRAKQIETNDYLRKSNYSFHIVNNELKIFPRPKSNDAGNKVYFEYYLRSDKTASSRGYTDGKVSDPSNVPYKFITYSEINAHGRQWIRRYCLALSKELLGIVRSKYASMPIPNGEVSLDGEALKAEGREEKANLLEELKEFLESVSLTERTRHEQEQAESQQSVLNKAPLKIYIG